MVGGPFDHRPVGRGLPPRRPRAPVALALSARHGRCSCVLGHRLRAGAAGGRHGRDLRRVRVGPGLLQQPLPGSAAGILARSPHYTADLLPVMRAGLHRSWSPGRRWTTTEPLRRPGGPVTRRWIRRGLVGYLVARVAWRRLVTTGRVWERRRADVTKPYLDTLIGEAAATGPRRRSTTPASRQRSSIRSSPEAAASSRRDPRPLDLPLRFNEPDRAVPRWSDEDGHFREAAVVGGRVERRARARRRLRVRGQHGRVTDDPARPAISSRSRGAWRSPTSPGSDARIAVPDRRGPGRGGPARQRPPVRCGKRQALHLRRGHLAVARGTER